MKAENENAIPSCSGLQSGKYVLVGNMSLDMYDDLQARERFEYAAVERWHRAVRAVGVTAGDLPAIEYFETQGIVHFGVIGRVLVARHNPSPKFGMEIFAVSA
jgi:hypothetical protein